MHLPSRFLIVHSSRSHGSPQLRAFRPPSLASARVARAEGTDPCALRCASNEGSATAVKSYGRGPRLSTRSTGAPCASTVPRLGDSEITRPARKVREYALCRSPLVQPALTSAAFAAVRPRPTTFGTLQSRPDPVVAGALVVNVSSDCPEPIVTTAAPAAGVLELIVLAPPAIAIEVTAYPAGTFSVTVTGVPCG